MDAWDELDTWVRTVWGGCSGYLELTTIAGTVVKGQTRRKLSSSHFKVDEWDTTSSLQLAENADLYLGCCTVKEPPQGSRRGTYEDRWEMPGLWLDIDIGDVGHKPSADGLKTFPDVETAVKTLGECGYPEPSALVFSGGGVYPWWLFREPLLLDPASRKTSAQEFSDKWHQHAFNTAREHGLKVDKLGDLPRFLRPPGTWNLKEGQRRPTRLLEWRPELRYDPNDLWTLVASVEVGTRMFTRRPAQPGTPAPDAGILDALRGCEWRDIFQPAGWALVGYRSNGGEEWMRPGKDLDDVSASGVAWGDIFVCFSEKAGLPYGAGKGLTKLRVFAWLWFGGSIPAALQDLSAAVRGQPTKAPWSEKAVTDAAEAIGYTLEFVQRRLPQGVVAEQLVGTNARRITIEDAEGTIRSVWRREL